MGPLGGMLDYLPHRLGIAAECRRLYHLVAKPDMREAEAPPDEEAIAERPLDFVRLCRSPDVEVLGLAPHQKIAHAATHEIGGIAEIGEAIENFQGVWVDVFAGNAMIRPLIDGRRLAFPLQKTEH